jgi:hypothetical protein
MTNPNIHQEILSLTKRWQKLISSDHHKDRDCRWYIETVWKYGEEPKYYVTHYGYINDDIMISCPTYEDALETLRSVLDKVITKNENE